MSGPGVMPSLEQRRRQQRKDAADALIRVSRGKLARKALAVAKHAVVVLQAGARRAVAVRETASRHMAILVLERRWRGALARMRCLTLRRLRAAIRVQASARKRVHHAAFSTSRQAAVDVVRAWWDYMNSAQRPRHIIEKLSWPIVGFLISWSE